MKMKYSQSIRNTCFGSRNGGSDLFRLQQGKDSTTGNNNRTTTQKSK